MIERVATGIHFLDETIVGLPKNKATFVIGKAGVGKTIMGLQFARTGLYTDEHVAYFTAKDAPEQMLTDMRSLGWDLTWALEQDRLKIIDIKDYFWNATEDDLETSYLTNFFMEIENLIKTFQIKRLVFDPVIPHSLFAFPGFYVRYVSELIRFLENPQLSVTSLMLHTEQPDRTLFQQNMASNVIHMFFTKEGDVYKRTALIQKMQNTYYQPKELFFDIIHEKGLVTVS